MYTIYYNDCVLAFQISLNYIYNIHSSRHAKGGFAAAAALVPPPMSKPAT